MQARVIISSTQAGRLICSVHVCTTNQLSSNKLVITQSIEKTTKTVENKPFIRCEVPCDDNGTIFQWMSLPLGSSNEELINGNGRSSSMELWDTHKKIFHQPKCVLMEIRLPEIDLKRGRVVALKPFFFFFFSYVSQVLLSRPTRFLRGMRC